MPHKIAAITKGEQPKAVTELRTFLGLINYYQKFLPNLSTRLNPLNNLLKKDIKFTWTKDCEKFFIKLKEDIMSTAVLISYKPNLPLILATHASSTGLGASYLSQTRRQH